MADGLLLRLRYVKDLLKVQHHQEDALLEQLIAESEADFQTYTGRRIALVEHTEKVDGGHRVLRIRHYPIDVNSPVEITDTDTGDVLPTTDYRVVAGEGQIYRGGDYGGPYRTHSCWSPGRERYQVRYTGGLQADPDWTIFEETIRGSVAELVVLRYEHRNPALKQESLGERGALQYDTETPIPKRIMNKWDRFREVVI